jgi:hypothetical protein
VNIFRCPPLPTRHQLHHHHHHQQQHAVPMRLSQQASSSLQIHYEEQEQQQQNIQIDEMETFELQPVDSCNHALISSNEQPIQETHLLTMMEVKNDEQQNNNQLHGNRAHQFAPQQHQVVTSQVQHQHQHQLGITFAEQQFHAAASQRIQLPELQRSEIMQHHLQLNSQQQVQRHQQSHHQLMQVAPISIQPQISAPNQAGSKGGLIECPTR